MTGGERRHATCLRWLGFGLLLEGASGSGKSDLALRLIEAGADLVADDAVLVEADGGILRGHAIPPQGRIEMRGAGILAMASLATTRLDILIEMGGSPDRLPETESAVIAGQRLPRLRLDARAPSAVAQIRCHLLAERIA